MPKLKGKQVNKYLFGECLAELSNGSQIAQAVNIQFGFKCAVFGIPSIAVEQDKFIVYSDEVGQNLLKIYPIAQKVFRSQNYIYLIFEELSHVPVFTTANQIKNFGISLQRIYSVYQQKINPSLIFSRSLQKTEICILPDSQKSVTQSTNNLYVKFHNKSVLSQFFGKHVAVTDEKKAVAIFSQCIQGLDLFQKLSKIIKTTSSIVTSKFISLQELEEYPDIDDSQFDELMSFYRVNPSLKEEAGQIYIRQSVKDRNSENGDEDEINRIVQNVNHSIINVPKMQSNIQKQILKKKLIKMSELCEFEVYFESHFKFYKLLKKTIKSYLQKYKSGFAGIVATYFLLLIGLIRKLKTYADLTKGIDIFQVGVQLKNDYLEKYGNIIKQNLGKQAKSLIKIRNIIQNANLPMKTYQSLLPFLQEDISLINFEQAQKFSFFYMSILMQMDKSNPTFHEILVMETMYVLIHPIYSIVYSENQMPNQWDPKHYQLRKLLISTSVNSWKI